MIYFSAAILLLLIGLYAVLVKRNLVKMIIGLSIIDSGINLLLISIGYIKNGTAPIFSKEGMDAFSKTNPMVDPVPQALVLTAIVIGLAVTAVALSLVIRIYRERNTLDIKKIQDSRS